MADARYPRATTPRGTAIWPRLNTPDTKYKAEGKYEAKIAIDADAPGLEAFMQKVNDLTDKHYDEVVQKLKDEGKDGIAAKVKKAYLIKPEEDEKTGEETGRMLLKASMTASGVSKKTGKPWSRRPDIFDGTGKQLKNPPQIGSGSILKLSVELFPYFNTKDKEVFVSFRLEGVQVIKLVSFGERDASAHGFGAEEDADEIEDRAAANGFGDETGGAGSDDEDDDL